MKPINWPCFSNQRGTAVSQYMSFLIKKMFSIVYQRAFTCVFCQKTVLRLQFIEFDIYFYQKTNFKRLTAFKQYNMHIVYIDNIYSKTKQIYTVLPHQSFHSFLAHFPLTAQLSAASPCHPDRDLHFVRLVLQQGNMQVNVSVI